MGVCIAIQWHLWMPQGEYNCLKLLMLLSPFELKRYFQSETSGEELEAESCQVFFIALEGKGAGTAGSLEDVVLSFYQRSPPLTVLDRRACIILGAMEGFPFFTGDMLKKK